MNLRILITFSPVRPFEVFFFFLVLTAHKFIAIVEASSLQLQPPTMRLSDLRSHRHLLLLLLLLLLCLARFLALSLSVRINRCCICIFASRVFSSSSSSSPILCRWWTARTTRLLYLLLLSTTEACFHCQPLMLAVKDFLNLIGTCSFI